VRGSRSRRSSSRICLAELVTPGLQLELVPVRVRYDGAPTDLARKRIDHDTTARRDGRRLAYIHNGDFARPGESANIATIRPDGTGYALPHPLPRRRGQ